MHKTWGGIIAGVFFVLPSLFILIGLSWVYLTFGESTIVTGLFYGIKPAITAAVVGVILNLALFFSYHVLWPHGWSGQFDVVSAVFTLLAILLLFYFKRKMPHVLIACALLDLAWQVYVGLSYFFRAFFRM